MRDHRHAIEWHRSAKCSHPVHLHERRHQAERSHSVALVRTIAKIVSGHSVIDHASDRCTAKTGYSRVDGTKLSVED